MSKLGRKFQEAMKDPQLQASKSQHGSANKLSAALSGSSVCACTCTQALWLLRVCSQPSFSSCAHPAGLGGVLHTWVPQGHSRGLAAARPLRWLPCLTAAASLRPPCPPRAFRLVQARLKSSAAEGEQEEEEEPTVLSLASEGEPAGGQLAGWLAAAACSSRAEGGGLMARLPARPQPIVQRHC